MVEGKGSSDLSRAQLFVLDLLADHRRCRRT
jgi:hypothetical protein